MAWNFNNFIYYGVFIQEFLPNSKIPNFKNKNFKDIYLGDTVFIFLKYEDEWGKGFVFRQQMPDSFTIISKDFENVSNRKYNVLIFPLSFIKILKKISLSKKELESISINGLNGLLKNDFSNLNTQLSSMVKLDVLEDILSEKFKEINLDFFFLDEIDLHLMLLTDKIYFYYSISEFRIYSLLYELYEELNEIRFRLKFISLTKNENCKEIQKAINIINRISKIYGSLTFNYQKNVTDNYINEDRYGYSMIIARDEFTGEILTETNSNCVEIAVNQIKSALSSDFPINFREECIDKSSSSFIPFSHILLNIKSVKRTIVYDVPFSLGFKLSFYIRTSLIDLTEQYTIFAESIDDFLSIQSKNLALFRSVPVMSDNKKIFLVAVLTEEIDLSKMRNTNSNLKRMKQVVSGGLCDITKIFSVKSESLKSDVFHEFNIMLFTLCNTSNTDSNNDINDHKGLIDSILESENNGIFVNPRAEQIHISIKELNQLNVNFEKKNDFKLTQNVDSLFHNEILGLPELLYLKVNKLNYFLKSSSKSLFTIEVFFPELSKSFCQSLSEDLQDKWIFSSVNSNKFISETVNIVDFDQKKKNTFIIFNLYHDKDLIAHADVLFKSDNEIININKPFNVVFSKSEKKIAELGIFLQYKGKKYNQNRIINDILNPKKFLDSNNFKINYLIRSLEEFCNLSFQDLSNYFFDLIKSFFNIYLVFQNFETIHDSLNNAIIYLFDTFFGKFDTYKYYIDILNKTYSINASVSKFILKRTIKVLNDSNVVWNSASRSLCRIFPCYLMVLLNVDSKICDFESFLLVVKNLLKTVIRFFAIDSSSFFKDKNYILKSINVLVKNNTFLKDKEIFDSIIELLDIINIQHLVSIDDKLSIINRDLKNKLFINSLIFIINLFDHVDEGDLNLLFYYIHKTINWVLGILKSNVNVNFARLCCTIIYKGCKLLQKYISFKESLNTSLLLDNFLSNFSNIFLNYYNHAKMNDMFVKKRTYYELFSTQIQSSQETIDSIISNVCIIEFLVELAVIFCYVTKIKVLYIESKGNTILSSNKNTFDSFVSIQKNENLYNNNLFKNIEMINLLIDGDFYPSDKWISLSAVITNGCSSFLNFFKSEIISSYYKSDPSFKQLEPPYIKAYLTCVLKLYTVRPSLTDGLFDVPKYCCSKICVNIKQKIANCVNDFMNSLSIITEKKYFSRFHLEKNYGKHYKIITLDTFNTSKIFIMSLQSEEVSQSIAIKIIWTTFISSYILNHRDMSKKSFLSSIQKKFFLALYNIYKFEHYKPIEKNQQSFITKFFSVANLDKNDDLYDNFNMFIDFCKTFFKLINQYESVPSGPEFEDERNFQMINYLKYLKTFGMDDKFNEFIKKIYDNNKKAKNFVQEGLCLELLASNYSWDCDDILKECPIFNFPNQSSFERKENLYKQIIDIYFKAKYVEKSITICNELLKVYSENTGVLRKYSYIHGKLAKLYANLELKNILSFSFYRISFFGTGFPENFRNKEIIFEGFPFEHITSFQKRLIKLYPGSRIIFDEEKYIEIKDSDKIGRFIYFCSVEPMNDVTKNFLININKLKDYSHMNNYNMFTLTKKIFGCDNTNIKNMSTEIRIYETLSSFPLLGNRSEIKNVEIIKLSPLENSIRMVLKKIEELLGIENELYSLENELNQLSCDPKNERSLNSFSHDSKLIQVNLSQTVNDMTRVLYGIIDTPVNGGLKVFYEFFENKKYNKTKKNGKDLLFLRNTFLDLKTIIGRCIDLQGKHISPNLKKMHQDIINTYEQNFKIFLENISKKEIFIHDDKT